MRQTLTGTVRFNKLRNEYEFVPFSPKEYQATLKDLRKSETVMVRFAKKRPIRTIKQNRYYWSLIKHLIMQEIGYTQHDIEDLFTGDQLHELFKSEFLTYSIEFEGLKRNIPLSTTELTTFEFNRYIDQIKDMASYLWGIYLPNPDEII